MLRCLSPSEAVERFVDLAGAELVERGAFEWVCLSSVLVELDDGDSAGDGREETARFDLR